MAETKNQMLRRAILKLDERIKKVPDRITSEDVNNQWLSLSCTGYLPLDILRIANSTDESLLPDSLMRNFMDALNWYNEYHT